MRFFSVGSREPDAGTVRVPDVASWRSTRPRPSLATKREVLCAFGAGHASSAYRRRYNARRRGAKANRRLIGLDVDAYAGKPAQCADRRVAQHEHEAWNHDER